ncbi:MAG: hypothetical protein Q4C71_04440 [Microbacteriaceae bacterium]|nr:hypothetical protein [Microbacteriaceae bacterium]
MIVWFALVLMGACALGLLLTGGACALGKKPNDITLGVTALVALLLLAQTVIAIIAPFAGNPPAGDPLEFWLYLVVALAIPVGGIFWALIDRTRWSHALLALAHFSLLVMVYRMLVIWGIDLLA